MRKILRMFLVCLMTMFCGTVMADEVTINFNEDYQTLFPGMGTSNGNGSTAGDFTTDFTTSAVSGITFTVSPSGGSTKNRLWSSNPRLRMYGGTLTIKSEKAFSKIVFTISTNDALIANKNTVNSGTLSEITQKSNAEATWTGEETTELILTIAGNTQFSKAVVTLGGGSTITVPTPSISGATPFTENTEVTISGTPEGGKTYYTTDGSDPTSSSTLYSDPFTLTETTTVKAISYDKDNNASSVASKKFEKETLEKAANIAALLAFEKGKKVTVTLNNAIVLYKGTNDIIIKDATGGTDFYQTGLELTKGQVLNGTITVLRDDYNGFKEAKKTDGTNLDNVTVTEGTVTPTNSTVANVATSEDCADLYKLENVEVVANGSNWDIVDGETTLRLRDQFKLNYTATAGKFNIIGVIGNYNGTKQFWPTEAPEATQEITIGEVSDINEFKAQPKGKPYNLTLENAQVVYAWTNSKNGNIQAFVRDETGALSFYFDGDFKSVGSNFVTNKIVNGTIIVNNEEYRGLPQASAIAETNTEKLTFTDGSEAQPVKITAADVSKNINDLVLLENVTIEEKDGKYYVGDVQLYDQFGIIDLSSFVGEGKNVKGIAVVYNTTYEIYPIEITSQGGGETPATSGVMIKFAEEDVCAKGAAKAEYSNGDFKLTCVDTKAEKLQIDGSSAYFGTAENYQKFTHRLKTNGKSSSSNSMSLTIPSDGTLKIYVRTATSSDATRNLVLTQDEKELYHAIVKENEETDYALVDMGGETPTKVFPVISVSVKAGEVTIGYPENALNFYAFEFIAGSTGIQNVVKPVVENGIRYNLAGQRVDENYKGVVIMNGKKYVVK